MDKIIIRNLGLVPYESTWQQMKDFTENRTDNHLDELWVLEHLSVFTQGQAGKKEHLHDLKNIPVIQSDRGGQVTYHGPGQLILYPLLDIRRKNLSLKSFINALENAVIAVLADYEIKGQQQFNAPGVYVNRDKIAFLGLRIKRGCSYHGLSLNVAMDLKPFNYIDPCGYPDLKVVQMQDFNPVIEFSKVKAKLIGHLTNILDYTIIK